MTRIAAQVPALFEALSGMDIKQLMSNVKAVQDTFMEKVKNVFSIDEMLEDMTTIYQRHFTRNDVDALIAFYSSPAGQHLLNEQPAIMREYMPVVMKRIGERTEQLNEQMTKDMEEAIKSAGNDQEKK
jgi:hypothetical protein